MIAIDLKEWIEEHRHLLKPPVGNRQIWAGGDFMVTVVGGPNSRADFHVNQGEEFFHQMEGDIVLRIIENGTPRDLPIREGSIFLLPPGVPHSPQRPAGSVGLVIERKRAPGELDGFLWLCPRCQARLYEEYIPLNDLVKDLPPVFDRFYGKKEHCTCPRCGHVVQRGDPPA